MEKSKNTSPQKFRTTLLQGAKTATGIKVPAEIVERLTATRSKRIENAIGLLNGSKI